MLFADALPAFLRRLPFIERRREERITDRPLTLRIDGYRYLTADWSIGGFRLPGFHRPITTGAMVEGKISRFETSSGGPFRAEVVRITDDGQVAMQWRELPSASYQAMEEYRNKRTR